MKAKYLYRLWFPNMGHHGESFDKISDATQREIEKALDGWVMPVIIGIDTSTSKTILKIGQTDVEFDKESTKAFMDWFDSLNFVHFGGTNVELWRNKRDEPA